MDVSWRRIGLFAIVTALTVLSEPLRAQVNVTTYHNNISRTGEYTNESILTRANVNSSQFGKLFNVQVDGYVYAQPLYLSNIFIGGGTHNVLFVATEHDSVYAVDADTGVIYWQVSLIAPGGKTVNSSTDLACGDLVAEIGITGTPVIDPATGTLYVVAKSKVGSQFVHYLHALDIGTATEKFGAPVLIQGSVQKGDGTMLAFDPFNQHQRAALLLEQGHVVISWNSHCDFRAWYGWVMSYNAGTLTQEGVFNDTPNGVGGGIWMGGSGVSADTSGNLYFATGNGPFDGTTAFGDSIVKLGPPSGGTFPVLDYFAPYNQANLDSQDLDLASGGVVLLPTQSGGQQLLIQSGKVGDIFVLDRTNLGKYCGNSTPACTTNDPQIFQEIQHGVGGIFGSPAYWNGYTYWSGVGSSVTAMSVNANGDGKLSSSPTSKSTVVFGWPASSPTVSSNGQANGIVWALNNTNFDGVCTGTANCQELYAFDATNLATLLYSSNQAPNNRDVPGSGVKFAAPIIANGKVYFGGQFVVSAYGLLSSSGVTAVPTFNPGGGVYSSAQTVTIADATPGATIYYTTNGTTPTTASASYSVPISVSATQTLKAIAVASGFSNSPVASAAYTITVPTAATPTFTPAAGTYGTAQSVRISDNTVGATIYYTTNGTTPTTASASYSAPISVSATQTLKAIAVASGYTNSAVASATYTIGTGAPIVNDPSGFASTAGFTFVGGATLQNGALLLSDGGLFEAHAVWYATPVNVQSFTSDFNFQITAAAADGFTFTLQNSTAGSAALGTAGGQLGYAGITPSVAVKFDIFNNAGEGSDSTGIYVNGATPTVPAVDMTSSGVTLSSGHVMHAHLTYDGTTLALTITDTVSNATFSTSKALNIPATVGGNTAYVGFTAGTGGSSATQNILNWTYAVK